MENPIIEKINKEVPFVSNSLRLDKDTRGLILSGINGMGKSSCLKNIGIMLIIAQIGYYVPCKRMKYVPFNSILTKSLPSLVMLPFRLIRPAAVSPGRLLFPNKA